MTREIDIVSECPNEGSANHCGDGKENVLDTMRGCVMLCIFSSYYIADGKKSSESRKERFTRYAKLFPITKVKNNIHGFLCRNPPEKIGPNR